MSAHALPLPEPTALSEPYWNALRQGKLMVQRCGDCGRASLPARAECPYCLSANRGWERASGRGELLSWVVYHIAYHEAFKARLPYNVAVVRLDEGPQMLTNIIGANDRLVVGARVKLHVEHEDGFALARFELDQQG